jgi:hypothetical protein
MMRLEVKVGDHLTSRCDGWAKVVYCGPYYFIAESAGHDNYFIYRYDGRLAAQDLLSGHADCDIVRVRTPEIKL